MKQCIWFKLFVERRRSLEREQHPDISVPLAGHFTGEDTRTFVVGENRNNVN